MSISELQTRLQATKDFLNRELVRNKVSNASALSFREIGSRLDMIHEIERTGIRNMSEIQERKLNRMIRDLEMNYNISLN
jgi:hypothetical protein